MDDTDLEEHYLPRYGPMFSRGGTARAQMATDLAIPILAEGGWSALTLRNVADAANVTPQAIAAWFPSVGAMRVAVAARYGDRWICEREAVASQRMSWARATGEQLTQESVVEALLPQSWLEEVFDGIWLTIVEAGRWDEAIGAAVADVEEREEDLIRDLLESLEDFDGQPEAVETALSLVRGRRLSRAVRRTVPRAPR